MTYTLTLSEENLNLIGAALRKLPHEVVDDLLKNLVHQIHTQQNEARKVEAAPPPSA